MQGNGTTGELTKMKLAQADNITFGKYRADVQAQTQLCVKFRRHTDVCQVEFAYTGLCSRRDQASLGKRQGQRRRSVNGGIKSRASGGIQA